MERIFKIEWPDHLGPNWMNQSNLELCIMNFHIGMSRGLGGVKVRDITVETRIRRGCAVLGGTCVDCKEKCPFSHNLP